MKQILIFVIVIIIAIIFLIFQIYEKGEESGKAQQLEENYIQQGKIQHETIEEAKAIPIRKSISKSISTNDNLVWLEKNRCRDCQNQ